MDKLLGGGARRNDRPLCIFSIYWSHIPKDEKTGERPAIPLQNNVQCKLLFSRFAFYTPADSKVWFDQYLGIAPNNHLLFAFSLRRFEKILTTEDVIKWCVPRIPDYATPEFIKKYTNGCRMEIMGVYEIKAQPMELQYKNFW